MIKAGTAMLLIKEAAVVEHDRIQLVMAEAQKGGRLAVIAAPHKRDRPLMLTVFFMMSSSCINLCAGGGERGFRKQSVSWIFSSHFRFGLSFCATGYESNESGPLLTAPAIIQRCRSQLCEKAF